MAESPRRRAAVSRALSRAAPAGACVVLAVGLVLTFTTTHLLVRWTATVAVLAMILVVLRGQTGRWMGELLRRPVRAGSTLTRGALLAEVLCPLLVAGATCGTLWRVFTGDAPLGTDHPIHLFHGWVMAERLLPTGRLSGWVPDRGAGYPAGVLYPIGAPILLALVRFVTPSSVGWDVVYGVGFLLAWCAVQLAMYLAGRLSAGPAAGLFAGLFSLLDRGAYRQSGYTFAVEWGVWPVSLSMGLGLASVFLLHNALTAERNAPRRLAAAALLAGAAIVTHPMSLAYLGLALPIAVVHAAMESPRRRPVSVIVSGCFAAALGVGVAAFWLLPFISLAGEARTLGTGSFTLRQQAEALVRLDLFQGFWAIPAAFAVMGGIGAWRSRLPTARLATLLLAIVALAVNGTTLTGLEIDRFWERLSNVQPDRFYMYLRPMAYVLGGAGVAWAFRRAGPTMLGAPSSARTWALRITACLAFGAFLVPFAEAVGYEVVGPRASWRGHASGWSNVVSAMEFIREDAARRGGHVRSTWPSCEDDGSLGHGSHCFELSPAWTGIGHLHEGYHSGAAFTGLFDIRRDPATLRALGVRYRVELRDRPRDKLLHRAGPLRVYEVPGALEVPYALEGSAQVRPLAIEDERIRLEVSGASEGDEVVFHIPSFPRWHAFIDGVEVPIARRAVGSIPTCMAVRLRDGVVELRYVRGPAEAVGTILTVLSLLGCLLIALAGPLGRTRPATAVRERWAALVAAPRGAIAFRAGRAALIAALVAGALVGAFRVGNGFLRGRPRFDTVIDFADARVWYLEGGARHRCRRTWSDAFRCGSDDDSWVGPRYVWTRMGDARGVISAAPRGDAELHVDYPAVRMGRSLAGGIGIENSGGGRSRVTLRVRAGGAQVGELGYTGGPGWQSFSIPTTELEGRTVRLELIVTCPSPARRHFIFRARTVD